MGRGHADVIEGVADEVILTALAGWEIEPGQAVPAEHRHALNAPLMLLPSLHPFIDLAQKCAESQSLLY